jgi:hypothetical protein
LLEQVPGGDQVAAFGIKVVVIVICSWTLSDLGTYQPAPQIYLTSLASEDSCFSSIFTFEFNIATFIMAMTNWWKPACRDLTKLLEQILDVHTLREIVDAMCQIDDVHHCWHQQV